MTPEHKALVDALTRKAETDGLLSVEDIRSVAESLPVQPAQPQAGEPVAMQWRKKDRVMKHDDVWNYVDYHTGLKIAEHPEKYETRPLYASPQPAKPAQVTDAMVEAAAETLWPATSPTWKEAYNSPPSSHNGHQVVYWLRVAKTALTAAIGADGKAVAHPDDQAVDRFAAATKAKLAKKRAEGRGGWDNRDECTAEHLSYLLIQHIIKGDPLDVGNLAMMLHQRGDRIVIDDETRSIATALSQPHSADERVVEALEALRIDRDNEAERKVQARRDKDATLITVHAYAEGVLAGHVKSFEAALAQEGRKNG